LKTRVYAQPRKNRRSTTPKPVRVEAEPIVHVVNTENKMAAATALTLTLWMATACRMLLGPGVMIYRSYAEVPHRDIVKST
jgi:hypothetical protein